jgi:tryptophan 2,3-dioxygenase
VSNDHEHSASGTMRIVDSETPRGEALRRALEAPIRNPILKKDVGAGDLDYEVYLHTRELLSLQTRTAELSVHDELMFQIVHQAQELWLKLVCFEAANLIDALDADDLWSANLAIERIVRAERCMTEELRVLDTLTPRAFLEIRRNLGNGSGQESPGYNGLRLAAAEIEGALARLFAKRSITLQALHNGETRAPDVLRLCEQLVDVDAWFQTWLVAHYMLVRRTIGVDRTVAALDGLPTTMLIGRMTQPLFRELWDVRVALTRAWRSDGGFMPGADRSVAGDE